ncbi:MULTISPECIES: DUF3288 family protein [Planktothricoides]|uniref:DUF3288 family protein n=2 Tax=Planktothricoides raciborskii TaxID=132608 RepID=A0AAU8J6S7_9CYAN|nr:MULTISPECIES: DUF3288 family protein [Planktothricoides]KOR36738.1 hypothetical protein AM228_11250 [Planktothricoides sp. SR001]MBD2545037.1 DUF3288 family protein [Planktothricoides raciborskii FACHB-1370]MBD2584825.1 DUF3288 family protein [Planktothricoides raciborskii FACHB-1261]
MSQGNQDQLHPLAAKDRAIVESLLDGEPTDYNLAELARLRIRYRGFPGAKDIQADLEKLLAKWNLTEEELFEYTRKIHGLGHIYRPKSDEEDWI